MFGEHWIGSQTRLITPTPGTLRCRTIGTQTTQSTAPRSKSSLKPKLVTWPADSETPARHQRHRIRRPRQVHTECSPVLHQTERHKEHPGQTPESGFPPADASSHPKRPAHEQRRPLQEAMTPGSRPPARLHHRPRRNTDAESARRQRLRCDRACLCCSPSKPVPNSRVSEPAMDSRPLAGSDQASSQRADCTEDNQALPPPAHGSVRVPRPSTPTDRSI